MNRTCKSKKRRKTLLHLARHMTNNLWRIRQFFWRCRVWNQPQKLKKKPALFCPFSHDVLLASLLMQVEAGSVLVEISNIFAGCDKNNQLTFSQRWNKNSKISSQKLLDLIIFSRCCRSPAVYKLTLFRAVTS